VGFDEIYAPREMLLVGDREKVARSGKSNVEVFINQAGLVAGHLVHGGEKDRFELQAFDELYIENSNLGLRTEDFAPEAGVRVDRVSQQSGCDEVVELCDVRFSWHEDAMDES